MEELLTTKVHLSGFNCNFTSETDPDAAARLFQEPWYTVHRDHIERLLFSELKRRYDAELKSVEFVSEIETLLEHIRREMGGEWSSLRWRDEFTKYDINGDGSLDRGEFKSLLSQFKFHISEQELADLWDVMDSEHNNEVNFYEFVQVACEYVRFVFELVGGNLTVIESSFPQTFQFDDWKEEAEKSKQMEGLVNSLLRPATARTPDDASRIAAAERAHAVETPKSIKIWAHILVCSLCCSVRIRLHFAFGAHSLTDYATTNL
jgi:hypothetical protein